MKILLATITASAPRSADFNFTLPDEPLSLSTAICPTPEERAECGCGRCFSGIESTRATTYAVVASAEESAFRRYFEDSPHVRGWLNDDLSPMESADVLWHDLAEISHLADIEDGTEIRADVTQDAFVLKALTDPSQSLRGSRSPRLQELVDAGYRSVERRRRFDDQ